MVISLFGEMNCTHRHVRSNEDAFDELFDLLSSARRLYAEKVRNGNMRPERFMELFCDSHHFISSEITCCRNAHRMNMGIVRGLYAQDRILFEEYLNKASVTQEDCSDLLHRYLMSFPPRLSKGAIPITLGGRFTEQQIDCFAYIAYTSRMFFMDSVEDARKLMADLLQCRQGYSVKVRNIRNVAVFFDELLANNLIHHNWQSTMEKGGFLVSPRSDRQITASTLSSALNRAKVFPTATQAGIRKAVRDMQEGHTTDR